VSRSDKKVRYAVVGQGWFAQEAVLPAFANATDNSELAALVSGNAEKRQALAKKYKVPAHGYEEYGALLRSGAIDAVYIVTPNSKHREHAVAAARAGVHVLCEKPLADTSDACREMIEACESANVRLMTAYRLHFEEANLKAVEIAKSGQIGEVRAFGSVFTMKVEDDDNVRLDAGLGGGPLHDIGVYCINAARYILRAEPAEVAAFAANSGDPKFREVPELVAAVMRFPGGRLATFTCGFGESKVQEYRAVGTAGDLRLDPAYGHSGDLVHHLTVGGKTTTTTFRHRDQVGPEVLYFSECVLTGRRPEPDGWEGLADVRVIEALYESAKTGGAVALGPFEPKRRPDMGQVIKRPPTEKPGLVDAAPPHGD
jgi:glucose-fructose oxidoreductase